MIARGEYTENGDYRAGRFGVERGTGGRGFGRKGSGESDVEKQTGGCFGET